MSEELFQLQRRRNALFKRYRRTKNQDILDEFIKLRKKTDDLVESAKTEYYHNRLLDALQNNDVWKELRSLGLLPGHAEGLNGFTCEDLNNYFASVSVSPRENDAERLAIIHQATDEGFKFHAINFNDVVLACSHFSSQARGVDGIPQSIIAKALPTIGNLLVRLFNTSLTTGVFPDLWKKAHVIPLMKCKTPSLVSDFRPIALLCFLSKMLERIAYNELLEHLTAHKILDQFQTGFRPYHSTETALLKLTDDIRLGIDKKLVTLLLLFDFSKAFDRISPTRLLDRLKAMGISRAALLWINSYFSKRMQAVSTRDSTSPWISTNSGVPQGSVLGPLLFCLYINDLRDVLTPFNVQYILYADDLQVYLQIPYSRLDEGIQVLRRVAGAISAWADGASLKLNASKTQAILFGCRRSVSDFFNRHQPCIELDDGLRIPFVNSVRSLGVILDSQLSWRNHVDKVTKTVNRVLYSLRFFRRFTTEALRRRLAEALLFPHLDYCSVVMLDATQEIRNRLQVLQNSFVRYVCGIKRDDHVSPYRRTLGWLRTDSRRQYFLAVHMYKIMRMRLPEYLECLFSRYSPRCAGRGITKELVPSFMRTETGKRSFQVQGAHLWNSLPIEIRNRPSLRWFKNEVRRHLLALD